MCFSVPEFDCDDRDDLLAYAWIPSVAEMLAEQLSPVRVAPVPAGFFPVYVRQREALAADLGFLAIVAPDLYMWRVGGLSVAQHHATSRPVAAVDQRDAVRNRKHREYRDGLRVRPLSEVA